MLENDTLGNFGGKLSFKWGRHKYSYVAGTLRVLSF